MDGEGDRAASSAAGAERAGSSAARIEAALTAEIAAGLHAPGERLDETRLAARFGTSRTPVREALGRLVAQGILASEARRGARVALYSREQLAQMFEAMGEIEAVCARLAAQRLTLLTRAAIEAAQAECGAAAGAGDVARYLRANEAFHAAIYAATQNPYVAELAAELRRRTGPARAKKFRTEGDLHASVAGHEALMAVIVSGDGASAHEGTRSRLSASYLHALSLN